MAVLLLVAGWFGVRFRLAAIRAKRLERQDELLLDAVDTMQAALVPEVPACLEGLGVDSINLVAQGQQGLSPQVLSRLRQCRLCYEPEPRKFLFGNSTASVWSENSRTVP